MMNKEMDDAIRAAIGAHGVWKMRLKQAITSGKSDASPDQVSCDDKCDFGRWLYGPAIPATLRKSEFYQDVRSKHAAFHACAGRVLTDALAGRKEAADQRLTGEFLASSTALVQRLGAWQKSLSAS